ncbi:MAG: cyclic nucleotide-binding domain-containing protein [Rhodothermales bacterium]|nr:cyclic nucleotide-binding domain-containing protein [Rhodothermales bacterium]
MKSNLLGKFYDTGATLIQQGEVGDCMFVLQEGEVAVLKEEDGKEAVVDVLKKGEIFGEMAIIEKQVRSATVRAVTPVRVLTIDKKTFLRRVHEDPTLALNVLKTMSGRIRKLDAELTLLKGDLAPTTGKQ